MQFYTYKEIIIMTTFETAIDNNELGQFSDDWGFYVDIETGNEISSSMPMPMPMSMSKPIPIPMQMPREYQYVTINQDRNPGLTMKDMINLGERGYKEGDMKTNAATTAATTATTIKAPTIEMKYHRATLIAIICLCLFL
jgi:hypothetical protein